MATLPKQVQPGDVISSELMNAILAQLAELGELGPAGTQVVPSVLGTRLADARALITQPSRQLVLGFVIDVSGAAVDPFQAANAGAIVLNQSPAADARVAPNTSVSLVVTEASTAPVPAPTITRTETPTGTVATAFSVNATMVVVGTGFAAVASQNTVMFNGTRATTVTADPADPTRRLLVVVPPGIPGAPVNPDDSDLPGVVVSVQPLGSAAATTTITVTAPEASQPTISSVSPASPFERQNITIVGTNFVDAARVLIRDEPATIVSITPTQIVATVPDFPDINPGAPPVPSSLVVSIPGVGDTPFTGTFRVRGFAQE